MLLRLLSLPGRAQSPACHLCILGFVRKLAGPGGGCSACRVLGTWSVLFSLRSKATIYVGFSDVFWGGHTSWCPRLIAAWLTQRSFLVGLGIEPGLTHASQVLYLLDYLWPQRPCLIFFFPFSFFILLFIF